MKSDEKYDVQKCLYFFLKKKPCSETNEAKIFKKVEKKKLADKSLLACK